MSSRQITLFVKSAKALAFLSFTTPRLCNYHIAAHPIPSGSQLSCQQAIHRTTGWLVEKKAFIPFMTNTRAGRIQHRVAIENGNYAEKYRTFPSNRPEKIVFYLSGEENQIWQ